MIVYAESFGTDISKGRVKVPYLEPPSIEFHLLKNPFEK